MVIDRAPVNVHPVQGLSGVPYAIVELKSRRNGKTVVIMDNFPSRSMVFCSLRFIKSS